MTQRFSQRVLEADWSQTGLIQGLEMEDES